MESASGSRRRAADQPGQRPAPDPGELVRRRIERALRARRRYRYVQPFVVAQEGGFVVLSPCCSRNVDASGGTIAIARLEEDPEHGQWRLFSREHSSACWRLGAQGRLSELLEMLQQDPQRNYWK